MTPVSSHSPHGQSPLRTVQVLGGGNAASSAHVRSLASGLVARGVRVTVCAPVEADHTYDFTGVGADHVHVPAAATRRRWPRSGRPARTPTWCTRTDCTPPSAPSSPSAAVAPLSS